jgi:para-aminobenzoate synthetase component 1
MIVDLVRNDLSIIAEKGSVFVKELFGLYSFPQVHQMISTIQATLAPEKGFADAPDACFPMGSMTGAPKKRVMELIEEYEAGPRGLFSGSIGYITPQADFDFNVVIRSIFYDSTKQFVSFSAGSGITFYCEAESEYDECISKAEAMMKVLA